MDKDEQRVCIGVLKGAEFKMAFVMCSDHSFIVFFPDFCPM